MKKLFAIIFIIFIILAGTTVYQFVKKDKYNLVLEIDKDKPLKESLSVLPVSNNPFFKLYLKFRNDGKDIKAGNYELRGKFNMIELVSMLESGKSKVFKFTIIEGSTVKNVIDKLVANGKGTRENYMKAFKEIDFPYPTPDGNFEGYLYPETYFIPESYDEKAVLNIFLKEFLKRFPVEKYPDKEEFYQKYAKEISAYRTNKLIGAGALRDYDFRHLPDEILRNLNKYPPFEGYCYKDEILYANIKIDDSFFTVPPIYDEK